MHHRSRCEYIEPRGTDYKEKGAKFRMFSAMRPCPCAYAVCGYAHGIYVPREPHAAEAPAAPRLMIRRRAPDGPSGSAASSGCIRPPSSPTSIDRRIVSSDVCSIDRQGAHVRSDTMHVCVIHELNLIDHQFKYSIRRTINPRTTYTS